ncbi:MAG: hypothetical protein P1V34_06175 [Alphaproteobacteria bacterium]|nr:hypothetical protein [Alphaproteobacteria bacterium]
MLPTNNSSIYRVATAYEAAKQSQTVVPDAAQATKEIGRARFFDALAGRYGLPGSVLSGATDAAQAYGKSDNTETADMDIAKRYDLSALSIEEILSLADDLKTAGRLDTSSADLMKYNMQALPFGQDSVFSTSPVAAFARAMGQGSSSAANRTLDLIRQQEEQIQYLSENDADPRALRGAKAVLGQLRLLQAEQTLYAQMDSARDRTDDRKTGGGFGPFGAMTDLMSLPASAIALFSA